MIRLKKTMRNISSRITTVKALLVVSLGISALLISCDESSIIGLNVQPTNDLLNVVYNDSSTLLTRSVKMDSLRTDAAQLQSVSYDALLGYYWDPTFGKTSASIYTQLTLSTGDPGLLVNPIVDSVVLSLVYDTAFCYGKTQKVPQNISVYQLSEDLITTNIYYSNHSPTLSVPVTDLANGFAFTPNLTSTNTIDGEVLRPCLRVPINASFGQSILNSRASGTLLSSAAFQSYMKGFFITTENSASINNGEGNILKINYADYQTRLRLYYHCDTANLKYDFSIGVAAALFSHFKHNFTEPNMIAQINGSTGKQNDIVYVQSMAGVKVKVEIPYVMSLNNSGIHGINKTELVIKVDTTTYQLGSFTPPAQLFVYGINDDGSDFVLSDNYEPANYSYGYYIGGTYNSSTAEYRINISRYIQQILDGKIKNNGLHLLAYKGAYNADRVVLGGGSSSAYRMKLQVTYTK
jgi:Domain of unknown function (DUF4270)